MIVRVEVPRELRTLAVLSQSEFDSLNLLSVARQTNLARVRLLVYFLCMHLPMQIHIDKMPRVHLYPIISRSADIHVDDISINLLTIKHI